jgi:hypothetical protein
MFNSPELAAGAELFAIGMQKIARIAGENLPNQ